MKRILLCNGSLLVQQSIIDLLQSFTGYKLESIDLKKSINLSDYDMVIVDFEKTGVELLRDIVMDNTKIRSKIVLMLSQATVHDIAFIKQANIRHIIKKPFNMKTLKDKIEKVVK